jgi:hypothetical protein
MNTGAAFPALMHSTASFRFAPAAAARLCQGDQLAEFLLAYADSGGRARCDPFLQAFEHNSVRLPSLTASTLPAAMA